MYRLPRVGARRLLLAGLVVSSLAAGSWSQTSVREVKVLGGKDTVEIEVEASDRLTPQTRVLTGPDRLVIDFPNAIPSTRLRNQSVNRGEVKDLRVGLFQSRPPVTRVVLDLKSPQSFQVFPYGRTVMIKVVAGAPENADAASSQPGSRPGLISANYTTRAEPLAAPAPPPKVEVSFREGLLAIRANKATLSEVLSAVQQQTGAEIAIAAGAEQEQVVVDLGPGPAADVIANLLHGSAFNFLILSAAGDPSRIDRVILTRRAEGAISAPLPQMGNEDVVDDTVQPPGQISAPPPPPAPSPQPDAKPADDNTPDQ